MANTNHRHLHTLTEIQEHLETISNRVWAFLWKSKTRQNVRSFFFLQSQSQRDRIRPILIEKQAQNEFLESSRNWLLNTTKHVAVISTEPISIQYDQTLNRLNDLLNETQIKLSEIQGINSIINDNLSFEQNRLQLIIDFENAIENISTLINRREQIQITVHALDEKVSLIQQSIKGLRTNLEHYRLSNNNTDELQVKEITE